MKIFKGTCITNYFVCRADDTIFKCQGLNCENQKEDKRVFTILHINKMKPLFNCFKGNYIIMKCFFLHLTIYKAV